jgi:hypothetical protein
VYPPFILKYSSNEIKPLGMSIPYRLLIMSSLVTPHTPHTCRHYLPGKNTYAPHIKEKKKPRPFRVNYVTSFGKTSTCVISSPWHILVYFMLLFVTVQARVTQNDHVHFNAGCALIGTSLRKHHTSKSQQ